MRSLIVILSILFLASCQDKEIQILEPSLEYINLNNVEVGYNEMRRFDLDGNGKFDVRFATYHIGDPLLKMDKIQFFAASQVDSYFPINADDNVTPLNAGDKIITRNTAHHDWYQVSFIVLAQKILRIKNLPFGPVPGKMQVINICQYRSTAGDNALMAGLNCHLIRLQKKLYCTGLLSIPLQMWILLQASSQSSTISS